VALTGVSSGQTSAQARPIVNSSGTVVAAPIGLDYGNGNNGNNYIAGDTTVSGTLGGVGFSGVAMTRVNNPQSNNKIDISGANSNSWTDPNRTMGSYYATLPGATANCTFTASITNGVMTVTATNSGCKLNVGDAITWAGQTLQDFIKTCGTASCTTASAGGGIVGYATTGTYNLASKDNSIKANVASTTMSAWRPDQLADAMDGLSKNNWDSNGGALQPAIANNYFRNGFGMPNPAAGSAGTWAPFMVHH
jgi:hypothetical protein